MCTILYICVSLDTYLILNMNTGNRNKRKSMMDMRNKFGFRTSVGNNI